MNKAKAMLDALMGPARDVSAKNRVGKADWKEKTVCKKFLVGFCPFDKTVLGGRRNFEPCPKIHNEGLRETFNQSPDGAPGSDFRRQCEDIALRDLQDLLVEKTNYGRDQLDRKKQELKNVKLPTEVNEKIAQMKREAHRLKDKAATLEDADARQKEQLENEAETMLTDREAYLKEEERKAQLKMPKPESCEVCGTGYAGEEEYKAHLEYRLHTAYVQIIEKVDELKAKKAESSTKKSDDAAQDRKQRMQEDIRKDEERASRGKDRSRSRRDKSGSRDRKRRRDDDRKRGNSRRRSRSRSGRGRR